MAILGKDKMLALVQDKEPQQWIEIAREDSKLYNVHFYGEGTAEHLTRIQGLESAEKAKARKKYAMSNAYITDQLINPMNQIFSAKGGSTVVKGNKSMRDAVKVAMQDVARGQSIDEYLRNEWKARAITDPNGLIYHNVKNKGEIELIHKSIFDINKMLVNGNLPEYIVFEPHKVEIEKASTSKRITTQAEDSEVHYIWAVDSEAYREYRRINGDVTLIREIKNTLGKVPAVQNSTIYDTSRKIKVSPIHMQMDLLESYLIDNSIHNIYKKLRGFPISWAYAPKCKSCNGTGRSSGDMSQSCSSCNGSGNSVNTDVSELMLLQPPTSNESPKVDKVAGFESPDLDTMGAQRVELSHLFDLMFKSFWGTTEERGGEADRATATGRFIDTQPVINKLFELSTMLEVVKSAIYDIAADHIAPNSKLTTHISTGKRFLVETPDQIWKLYTESKASGADDSTLDYQLSQYYEAEFQSDEYQRDYMLKLMQIDPFPHMTVIQLMSLESIPYETWAPKLAFRDWKNLQMASDIIESDLLTLRTSLNTYALETVVKPAEPKPETQSTP